MIILRIFGDFPMKDGNVSCMERTFNLHVHYQDREDLAQHAHLPRIFTISMSLQWILCRLCFVLVFFSAL